MNESNLPIIGLISIAIITSLLSHFLIKNYKKAIIVSSISSAVLFQVAVYIQLGYLDPFFMIAMVITGVITALISAVIGIPFNRHRSS